MVGPRVGPQIGPRTVPRSSPGGGTYQREPMSSEELAGVLGMPGARFDFGCACRDKGIQWMLWGPAGAGFVPSGSPLDQQTTIIPGDLAVKTTADAVSQRWTAGTTLCDAGAGVDLIACGVTSVDATPAAARHLAGKRGLQAAGHHLQIGSGAGGGVAYVGVDSGGNNFNAAANAAAHIGSLWAWVACWERASGANGQARVWTTKVSGAAVNPSAPMLTMTNVANFAMGRDASNTAAFTMSFLAYGVGAGIATGFVANLPTIGARFAARMGVS